MLDTGDRIADRCHVYFDILNLFRYESDSRDWMGSQRRFSG
jgi:hypothetical protein